MYVNRENGVFGEPRSAGVAFGGHAFVTPDDQTMILDSGGDIFASFRLAGGNWSHPMKVSSLSSDEFNETCPSLSPDGRFIFFARYDEKEKLSNIYWVSSQVLDKMRQKVLNGWRNNPEAVEAFATVSNFNRLWVREHTTEGMDKLCHPDMVLINPGLPERVLGRDRIIRNYRVYLDTVQPQTIRELEPMVQLHNHGLTAVVTYDYDLRIRVGEESKRFQGRDMVVLVRENGKWLVVADQFCPFPEKTE